MNNLIQTIREKLDASEKEGFITNRAVIEEILTELETPEDPRNQEPTQTMKQAYENKHS